MSNLSKPDRVFIAHGHDHSALQSLRDFVASELGLEPIILAEQASQGRTLAEKLEHYSRGCTFAIVLYTADDCTREGEKRARQNVVYELGLFHGLLGRERVMLLRQTDAELFSDISGLVWAGFSADVSEAFPEVRREVEAILPGRHSQRIDVDSLLRRSKPTRVTLSAWNGRFVRAVDGGGQCLRADRETVGVHEVFDLVSLGGRLVILRAFDGELLRRCDQGENATRILADWKTVDASSTFELDETQDAEATLRVQGYLVTAEGLSDAVLTAREPVQCREWERFRLGLAR